ncbi:hypothetical protein JRO89_XS05G0178200 [Xanthoceras sorbifolium]|uniref:Transmembrane protein n=1 Tax=Xanthoceras sorbifolium TaxID=99658 RepID=A0ABQ8I2A6_9ROSI|nr:hypothetical protein JRO89_XS05G0178200 [Xanthoceras sorbifolium]
MKMERSVRLFSTVLLLVLVLLAPEINKMEMLINEQRWLLRQGHASLKVTGSRGHASAKATVLTFAKLRASLVDIAEASVVAAFALENAKTLYHVHSFVFCCMFP